MTAFATTTDPREAERRRDEELLILLALLADSPSRFTYDASRLRFTTPQGTVPMRLVRRAVRQVIAGVKAELHALNARLAAGDITVGQWQADAAGLVKDLHVAVNMVASGGVFNLTDSDVGRMEGVVFFQLEHLEGFATDVARGFTLVEIKSEVGPDGATIRRFAKRLMTAKLIEMRLNLYGNSAHGSFEDGVREKAKEVGMRFERNILAVAENCDLCIIETAKGWVDIGTLMAVGARTCQANCLCTMTFSREKPE